MEVIYGEPNSIDEAVTSAGLCDDDAAAALRKSELRRQLREVFLRYAAFGRGKAASSRDRLSNHMFMKLMRDANLVSRILSTHVLDVLFSRQCRGGVERTISFSQFEDVS